MYIIQKLLIEWGACLCPKPIYADYNKSYVEVLLKIVNLRTLWNLNWKKKLIEKIGVAVERCYIGYQRGQRCYNRRV